MGYINVKLAAERWDISDRRVRVLCEQGKIDGVVKQGHSYLIPSDALKPSDGRNMRGTIIPQEYAVLLRRGNLPGFKKNFLLSTPITPTQLKEIH